MASKQINFITKNKWSLTWKPKLKDRIEVLWVSHEKQNHFDLRENVYFTANAVNDEILQVTYSLKFNIYNIWNID